ncbi:hypothetical protein [Paraburkholderia domus]|uniref:MmgE/PrpD C-terminal domain-containing protein n=1 Tax=Paraburkholderia domus TaxID=2793075 RepID=A0A9N8NA95_9BURK|nr:hypothetical protein [Paraburkholderia domus]MBK5053763.1 hypothetical protein [Burkholderia sp. R-70006]MBK5065587.1 hypothetical protein [Burkholderia sp. R-70199]MBK5170065.1 hypothetical protein [Burkholderia sp. R-70211]MBK5185227.1 hypothetical protein [Burkholderia sp. R-69749]CAE6844332.1 hypothetical protein R70006_07259 [Paraburkholderia domus]
MDDQCKATATTKDGRTVDVSIEHAVGSLARPMTGADIDAKFLANVQPTYSRQQAQLLLQTCRSDLSSTDVSTILDI